MRRSVPRPVGESEMNWFSAVHVQGVVLEETMAIHKAVKVDVIGDL